MFLQVSVCPHGGRGVHGFIQRGGMRGFIQGGMHGFIRGACMVLFGGCMVLFRGGMHGFIRGACVVLFGGGMRGFSGGACVVFSVFSDTMRYGQ